MKTKKKINESEMELLAVKTGLVFDGGTFDDRSDDRLFSETISTRSKDLTEDEYEKMEDDINDYGIKGKGFEVYAWNDESGFDYWTTRQEEDNYIQVTACIQDSSKVDPKELKNAMEKAYNYFFNAYSRKY